MRVRRTVPRPPETFGERVRRLRGERGWTQEELAWEAGVSQAQISLLERGTSEPRGSTLESLADVLDTTMDALWIGERAP
jgi:transcriptional regulator with XRE-family HTH domain